MMEYANEQLYGRAWRIASPCRKRQGAGAARRRRGDRWFVHAGETNNFAGARGELLRLAENARALAQPGAGGEIADLCMQAMGER